MRKIIACGVPRTGSTLIWQILNHLLPGRVIKAHPASWEPEDGCFIVGSIRHPYDTAGSCFRSRIVGDYGDGSPETVAGTKKGLTAELRMMNSNFEVLQTMTKQYSGKVVVLRYEEFLDDFNIIFNMIEHQIGVKVRPSQRRKVCNLFSFEANRKRSFASNPKERKGTRIAISHTAVGIPGSWKAIIPLWGYDLMKKWCDPLCKEWGYESQL